MTIIEHVRTLVNPKDYYTSTLSDIDWPATGAEGRVLCPFHPDKNTKSLSINPDNGKFYCHGCSKGGKSIVSFHALLKTMTLRSAAIDIFHRYVHPVIGDKRVRTWRRNLRRCPSAIKYLKQTRKLVPRVIRRFGLGFNNETLVIPIYNEFDLCVNAKFYSPQAARNSKIPKMQSYRVKGSKRSYGSPTMLYPLQVLTSGWAKRVGYVVVCEGEWDALILIGMGIPAVSATNGCKSWPSQYNSMFKGLNVIVAYDNDKDGDLYSKRPIRELRNLAKTISRLSIPQLPMGKGKTTKDVTDLYRIDEAFRTKKRWEKAFKKARLIIENDEATLKEPEIQKVALAQAADARFFKKRIQVDGLITGKDSSPYIVPQRVRISCTKQCDSCPLAEGSEDFKEIRINPADPVVLKLIEVPDSGLKKTLVGLAGMSYSPLCEHKVEIVKGANLEQIFLIPALDNKDEEYCIRTAYYVGHGLKSNRSYRFEGLTTAHPEDQHTTHLFDKASPVQDEIDTFEMTPELGRRLRLFRPRNLSLMAHLMNMAEWQSRNVTKIIERQDLHIAVDLAYHSLREFDFNGEYLKRGMLDVLIIGDTRCGKGQVIEGLMKYYRVGEIASGEMCTFAGLFGGSQQIGKRWVVTWGMIPLNHNRLVAVDEMSALSEQQIGKMSRVRSEGVAEINAIVRESTQANCRLIWASNSRSGREMAEHNTGVQIIKELIGANEDISRFDFAVTVATNEVDSKLINEKSQPSTDGDLYPAELCRSLVLWAWSRDRSQVSFTERALQTVIDQAIIFGKRYSSKVPLVQAENIRIKIAKIAAAVAARTFSTSEDYEAVIVKQRHVDCAAQFLKMIYSKPSMGYDVFSNTAIARSTMQDESALTRLFNTLGTTKRDVQNGLLELHRVTPDVLADYVGDVQASKGFIGDLVKLHCLSRIEAGGWYLKNPSFTQWLRTNRRSNGTVD